LRVVQSFDFRVGLAGTAMPALADDGAVAHQDRPDHGIGRGAPVTATGQTESQAHEIKIRRHGWLTSH
jgi:hypothetical protein